MQYLDGRRAEAASPWARLLRNDDRLTWTVAEPPTCSASPAPAPIRPPTAASCPVKVIGRRLLVPRVALLRLLDEDQAAGRA